jgi:SagB-type dehydrogenase family enzyme
MMPDLGSGGWRAAELWSLREDVLVDLPAGDGPVLLRGHWGNVTIERPSAPVREALRRMLLGPISLDNVVGARNGAAERKTAAATLALVRQVLDQLQPFIIRTLGSDTGQPFLSVVPVSPYSRFRPEPIRADAQIRLSTFAQLRTDGNEYRLESPLSLHRVLLHRPEAVWMIGSLARPVTAVSGGWPGIDFPAADVIAYLAAAGMVVQAQDTGEGGPPVFAEDAVLAGWSPADLMFHTRSTPGRSDDPFGVTYPLGRTGSPEQVARPLRQGPTIPLHRPRWSDLSASDPPLGVVMEGRRSTRVYGRDPVTARELGELLYRTARIRSLIVPPGADDAPGAASDPRLSDRPYPGGGACYELELYVTAGNCTGLAPGSYRYDPCGHELELVNPDRRTAEQMLGLAAECAASQDPPSLLITMTARYRRIAWKYQGLAYATVLKDVGIMFQSLYLVCTAMGLAPCAIGAVRTDLVARAFGADWLMEPAVGQFVVGRASDEPSEFDWQWQPVNDADWPDQARAALRRRVTAESGGAPPQLLLMRLSPVHGREQRRRPDPVHVLLGYVEHRLDQRVRQQVRLKAEVDQLGVRDLVVVLGRLDPRVVQVLDGGRAGVGARHRLGDVLHRHRLGHLVEHPEVAPVGRVLAGQLDAPHGVPDVDDAADLAAGPVDGQRLAQHGLDREPVQHRAEHGVIVEPGRQPLVDGGLRRLLAVHHALVEVGRPQVPDPAGELHVVAVVHLGQVVEGPRALGEQHPVPAAVVLELEPALLDVDVRRTVDAHRAQLDQVNVAVELGDRVEQVERADHVVLLGVDRVLAVDHRVRRGPLLGVVHDRVRLEIGERRIGELGVAQVADVAADPLPGQLPPDLDPGLQRRDRHQRLDPELVVVAAAGEVVQHRHLVPGL